MAATAPFSRFEWMIAWRYLRAKRAEGGVSVMTWISLVGITLAVFALIATLSVRAGFRAEFVDTILGANAHVTVYSAGRVTETGRLVRGFEAYDALAARVAEVPGVTRAAPLVKGQVMVTAGEGATGAEVFGIRAADLETIPRVGIGAEAEGDIKRFAQGIAIGSGIARELGVGLAWAVNTTRTANLWAYREATRANYAANPRVVSGWTWLATLDGRVCGNCLSQHGSRHALSETLNGHHQCRCVPIPELPLAKSLGLDLPEIEPGEAWFKRQDEATQQGILGPGMWAAWKDGAVSFDQFRGHTYDHPVYGAMQRMPTMAQLGLERYYTRQDQHEQTIE